MVGSGNFGGPKDSKNLFKVSTKKFDKAPDRSMEEKTNLDQATLYRLNGDYNPLHIDPQFASLGGFDKPILHGYDYTPDTETGKCFIFIFNQLFQTVLVWNSRQTCFEIVL